MSLFRGDDVPAVTGGDLALASAALLLEVATMDDRVDAIEREAIERILVRHFDLDLEGARQLIATAVRRQVESTQLLRFTRAIKDGMAIEQRTALMEWLWEVVYADGIEHDLEANLMRRIAGLIYVDDGLSGAARKRVRRRFGLDG